MEDKLDTKKTWRRVRTAIVWVVTNIALILLQTEKLLNLDKDIVLLFIEKSSWIAGLLIVGLTGTNAVMSYVSKNGK